MEINDPFSQSTSTGSPTTAAPNDDLEEDDIAFAAEAAANAVEEADAEQQRLDQSLLRCRICGQGIIEGRPILRFLPMNPSLATLTTQALPPTSPSIATFPEDICLHIFCGKTASILPTVNQPDMEILTKAGLKNKHGIGAEVNAALARTRCASIVTLNKTEETPSSANKQEKQYFLVREFEAHLAAIRSSHTPFLEEPPNATHTIQSSATVDVARSTRALQRQSQRNTNNNISAGDTFFMGQGIMTMSGNSSSLSTCPIEASASSSSTIPVSYPSTLPTTTPKVHRESGRNQGNAIFSQSRRTQGHPNALSTTGISIGSPPIIGSHPQPQPADAYHNISYAQVMSQQGNILMLPPPATMFTNASLSSQLGQISIPPPVGAVPLPPPLPKGPLSLRQNSPSSSTSSLAPGNDLGDLETSHSVLTNKDGRASGSPNSGTNIATATRAVAGKSWTKPRIADQKQIELHSPPPTSLSTLTSDGKVKCRCGGTYFHAETSKGAASWRSHVITKRHQRWIKLHSVPVEQEDDV